ncbi:electron transfer flavoprotein subunit beta/FixA family protein [Desulfocicer niacini]
MKILVCAKAVPENQESVEQITEYRMNLFDAFALEQAFLFRESLGEGSIDVISVGMETSEPVLTRAIGMGADQAIHIKAREAHMFDPFYTATLIAAHAEKSAYDLILAGVMSEDLMQSQVGPMVAELLLMPCATSVISAQISRQGVSLDRELEGGVRESWEFPLPCVLTLQSGINSPRYPSLSGMLRAARHLPLCLNEDDLGPPPARQEIKRLAVPEKKRNGLVLQGSPEEKAVTLGQILEEKGLLNRRLS